MRKIILFLPAILFVVDWIIKKIVPSISVEGGFLSFGFYKNYAGAFSLPIAGWLYNFAGIILLIIFIYIFYVSLRAKRSNLVVDGIATRHAPLAAKGRRGARNDRISLAYLFIILGGLSNMADRLVLGYTIDYVNFMNFSFFNIADGMLIIGIVILLYCHIVKDKKRTNNVAM